MEIAFKLWEHKNKIVQDGESMISGIELNLLMNVVIPEYK